MIYTPRIHMGPLVFVAGARPNFMKIAPLLRALDARGAGAEALLVHTGQHYDRAMSDVFFEQLGLREPDVHLHVGSGTHGDQTGRIMSSFDAYLEQMPVPPRVVVVVGDVNSTIACALVAAKRCVKVAHVEAGLRSFDRTMPEEINRIVTDTVSDRLLVSEPAGLENLAREGIPLARVAYCGNVMIDTLLHQLEAARALDMPARFGQPHRGYVVATLHRPSNVDDPTRLAAVLAFLDELSAMAPVVFAVHPRTRRQIEKLGWRARGRVTQIDPLGYREFIGLVDAASLVVSDSGGVQEETTFLDIPCLTLRNSTERPITLTSGTNVLAGDDLERALELAGAALRATRAHARPIEGWDGKAAERVIDDILRTC